MQNMDLQHGHDQERYPRVTATVTTAGTATFIVAVTAIGTVIANTVNPTLRRSITVIVTRLVRFPAGGMGQGGVVGAWRRESPWVCSQRLSE